MIFWIYIAAVWALALHVAFRTASSRSTGVRVAGRVVVAMAVGGLLMPVLSYVAVLAGAALLVMRHRESPVSAS